MNFATSVDVRVGDVTLPAVAEIHGSPSRHKPAFWRQTPGWDEIASHGGRPEDVSSALDGTVATLSETPDWQFQQQLLDSFVGRLLPGSIVLRESEVETGTGLLDRLVRRSAESLRRDQARYAARRERLGVAV